MIGFAITYPEVMDSVQLQFGVGQKWKRKGGSPGPVVKGGELQTEDCVNPRIVYWMEMFHINLL